VTAVPEPTAARPWMPGYGVQGPDEGGGLLTWGWATRRLTTSRHYWLATVWPDGRPHVMPVWGLWDGEHLWCSSSGRSRKARNLRADPRCTVTTEDPLEPVVLEGVAEVVTDHEALTRFLAGINAKYATTYGPELSDPAVNATFRIRPRRVIGLTEDDFTGSPTRWTFAEQP
jgi:PPOX class probable F420-dependent enzyme